MTGLLGRAHVAFWWYLPELRPCRDDLGALCWITNNYVLNAKYNFGRAPTLGRGGRLQRLAVGVTGLALSALLLHALLHGRP